MNDQRKINWSVVKEIESDGIVLEVSASDGRRPRYSVRIGRRGERGLVSFVPLFIKGQGKVQVVSIVETVSKLLIDAQGFVEEQAQKAEDQYIEERISREARGVEKDGKKRRSSGYKHHRPEGA